MKAEDKQNVALTFVVLVGAMSFGVWQGSIAAGLFVCAVMLLAVAFVP